MDNAFRDSLTKCDAIFDIMALFIRYIRGKEQNGKKIKSNFYAKEHADIYEIIEKYSLDISFYTKNECMQELKEWIIRRFKTSISVDDCRAFIYSIDNYIKPDYLNAYLTYGDDDNELMTNYDALNVQFHDTIRILPIIGNTCMNRFESKIVDGEKILRKHYTRELDPLLYKLKNYVVFENDFINKQRVTIHSLKPDNESYNNYISKKLNTNKITIAIFPTDKCYLKDYFNITTEKEMFEIRGGKSTLEILKNKYSKMMNKCNQLGQIDFAIFPEMLMTKEIYEQIMAKESNIDFIFNGTIWNNGKNRCHVSSHGKELLYYDKKCPFELKENGKTFTEALCRDPIDEYHFLDIKNLGRIGICICKDMTVSSLISVYKKMNTDLLFIPAFSSSLDTKSEVIGLCEQQQCAIIFANSCSAFWDKSKSEEYNITNLNQKKIGFVLLPGKRQTERLHHESAYFASNCTDKCGECCEGKLLTLDFDKYMQTDDEKKTIYHRIDLI